MTPARNGHLRKTPARYSGVCVLELIVAMPVIVMGLLAIVTFGLLLSESSHVLQAANVGAQQASLQARSTASDLVPIVASVVDSQLDAAGFSANDSNRQIIVEATMIDMSIASAGADLFIPDDALVIPSDSVRITVAVRLGLLSEDFLANYGFSIADGYAFHRVVKQHNGPGT